MPIECWAPAQADLIDTIAIEVRVQLPPRARAFQVSVRGFV